MDLNAAREGERFLNVGCGFDKREGYVNIDFQAFHEPDILGDALDLEMIPSNWADLILVNDVIEHFKRTQSVEALTEWNRVLRHNGEMRLRTTYLPGLLRRMNYDWFGSLQSHRDLIVNLFSSQAYEGDFHYTAFTEKLMRFYLWAGGFEVIEMSVRDNWLFEIVARKSRDYSYEALVDGESTDEEFVHEAYRQVLERNPDDLGRQGKLDLLKKMSRRAVVKGMIASAERENMLLAKAPEFTLEFDKA